MLGNQPNIPNVFQACCWLLAIDLCYVKGVYWTCVMQCLYPQEGQVLLYRIVLFANNV